MSVAGTFWTPFLLRTKLPSTALNSRYFVTSADTMVNLASHVCMQVACVPAGGLGLCNNLQLVCNLQAGHRPTHGVLYLLDIAITLMQEAPCAQVLTSVHQDSHELPSCHDKLGNHVDIVISAGSKLGRGFLPWPEPLIQLQNKVGRSSVAASLHFKG